MQPNTYGHGAAPWSSRYDDNDDSSTTTMGEEESINLLDPIPEKRQRPENTATMSEEESINLLDPIPEKRQRTPKASRTGLGFQTPSASKRAPVLSPATQTLNTLSQHDEIGGGDLLCQISRNESDAADKNTTAVKETNEQQEKCTFRTVPPTTKTNTQRERQGAVATPKVTPQPNANPPRNGESFTSPKNGSVQSIALAQAGPIGLVVARGFLSNGCGSACVVRQVVQGSQAELAGIQKGDLLIRTDKNGRKLPVTYEEVLSWPAQARPIEFSILRLPPMDTDKKSPPSLSPEQSVETRSNPAPKSQEETPRERHSSNQEDQEDLSSESDEEEEEIEVPFCQVCNGESTGTHHELCPKHPRFFKSGSDKKLAMLRQGVQAGCNACEWEWERGRRKYERHTCERGVRNSNKSQVRSGAFSKKSLSRSDTSSQNSIPSQKTRAVRKPQTDPSTPTRRSTSAREDKDELSVPFCQGCKKLVKGNKRVVHHDLCPKHFSFQTSGAKDKLDKIRRGVQAGCKSCELEWESGSKTKHIKHTCKRSSAYRHCQVQSPLTVTSPSQALSHLAPSPKDDASVEGDKGGDTAVPVCQGCKSGNGRNHHELCSKHPRFYASGGKAKLNKLRRGVEAGCRACEVEWESGIKAKKERHSCERGYGNKQSQVQSPLTVTSPTQSLLRPDKLNKPDSQETPTRAKLRLDEPYSPETPSVAKPEKKKPAVPFCKACNQGNGYLFHHALCPEHPQFDNSGAGETLKLMRRGVQVGCQACQFQYENGRVDRYLKHSSQCDRSRTKSSNNKRKKRETKKLFSKNKQAPTGKKRGRPEKTSGKGRASLDRDSRAGKKLRIKEKSRVCREASSVSKEEEDSRGLVQPLKKKQTGKRKAASSTEESTSAKKARGKKATECRIGETRRVGHHQEANHSSFGTPDLDEQGGDNLDIEGLRQATYPSVEGAGDEPINQTSWHSCPNPWGVTGHAEGDVVLFCPSGGFTHHESVSSTSRFSLDLFGPQSNYFKSHKSPQEGYHVVRLVRDRLASHPWGFTFRRHDFGGACLVDTVDPLSPAAVAVHVGSPEHTETRPSDGSAGLRVNDMIICINGQAVGGMTHTGLAIELDICGSELIMVVSRYKHETSASRHVGQEESNTWSFVDDSASTSRLRDWTEIGATQESTFTEVPVAPGVPDGIVCHVEAASTGDVPADLNDERPSKSEDCLEEKQPESDEMVSIAYTVEEASHSSIEGSEEEVKFHKATSQTPQRKGTNFSSDEGSIEWRDDDDEPWLGCVCGEIHPKPIPVFWIQCDTCDAWYSVSEDCLGFGEEEAKGIDSWSCWACSGPTTQENKQTSAAQLNSSSEGPQKDDNELSEYEKLRLKNIARNNARLEELGLLKKDVETAASRRKKSAAKAPAKSLPERRSRRTRVSESSVPSCSSLLGVNGASLTLGTGRENGSQQMPSTVEEREQSGIPTVAQDNDTSSVGSKTELLKPGTVVSVAKRTWPGVNKLGGIGKILKAHNDENGGILYDVRYVLGGRELDIEAEYVTRHEFCS